MTTTTHPTASGETSVDVVAFAAQLRVDAIRAAHAAGSGHVTSSLSAADAMAVLMTRHLRYDWQHPDRPDNDHLIFSKGHASPLLYAMFRGAGVLEPDELTTGYRRLRSRLQGHPTPELPWVDVATGSLGQGLPIGVGIAIAGQHLEHRDYRVWVLCGDSEMSEGSMWEALDKAGHYHLDNLTAIVDINRLGQSGPTALEWDVETYARRVESFGATAIPVDGHDLHALDAAYRHAESVRGPSVLLARTIKGRGVPEIEDKEGWHGTALDDDMTERAIADLGGVGSIVVTGLSPDGRGDAAGSTGGDAVRATGDDGDDARAPVANGDEARASVDDGDAVRRESQRPEWPTYRLGESVATRSAYGAALAALGARDDVVAMDGEVSNSTHAGDFAAAHPSRYFEAYIAECQLIATAVGMAARGYRPFASTFAAFVSRAYDFIRMAAISRANIVICGSHAGVEIGQDGPSQMALEDIAALRAVHGSTVLYPSDATACAALVRLAADLPGIVYLRTTRGAYPVLYEAGEDFPLGGSKVLRRSESDEVTIVAAGVTVHTALAAADRLAGDGIRVRVIDAYSVKPIDADTLRRAVAQTGGRVVIVEDHHPEGGLGSAVLSALTDQGRPASISADHLAVRIMPGSASGAEQLARASIDAGAITDAVVGLLSDTGRTA